MVSDVAMTSSEDGDNLLNAISKSLCFKCNSTAEPQFSAEQQIYLGDHLTRSWTKDERTGAKQTKSPVDSELGNRAPGTPSTYHTNHSHAPITRTRSSLREPRGSRKNWAAKTAIQNVTPEEFHEWKQSFDSLLRSPIGSKLFRDFLESEIAEENLLFWEACEEMKQIKKEKRRHKLIQTIHDDYISVHSPREINIDYKMKENIVEQLNSSSSPDPSLFSAAQAQIYHLMHRDSYPRFLASAQTLQDKMTEAAKRGSKNHHRSLENKRTSGTKSRVLCCYGDVLDDEEVTKNSVQVEEVKMKVCESPTSPVNGKAPTRSSLTKQTDERASSSAHGATVTSQNDTVKTPLQNAQVGFTSVDVVATLVAGTSTKVDSNSRKLSADSNFKRESGIEVTSCDGDDDDDDAATPERGSDVITTVNSFDNVTAKKTSEFEVPVDVIKDAEDSGVVTKENNYDTTEKVIAEVTEEKGDAIMKSVDEKQSCDVTEGNSQSNEGGSKLSDINEV